MRELLPRLTRRTITYALDADADIVGRDMQLEAFGSTLHGHASEPAATSTTLGPLRLRVPGRHNVLNALGAVAVGIEAGIPFSRIAAGLEEFQGAERRFQIRGEVEGRHGRGRLRPPPDRGRGRDCRRTCRHRPARGRGLSAAPFQPDRAVARCLRSALSRAPTRSC